MKLYKVEQVKKEYTTDLKEVVNRINCSYFVDVKNAKAEYFKAKKHKRRQTSYRYVCKFLEHRGDL